MRRTLAFLALAVAAVAVAWQQTSLARAMGMHATSSATHVAETTVAADSTLWIQMRNVDLHVDPQHAMRVRALQGQVVTKPGVVAWLDDPTSFRIRATSGEVALDGAAITALLNEVAFNYPDAPITNLRVTIEDGNIVQRGTLHKGVAIPFQMWSVPALQPDGRLKLHPDKLKILGVNGLSLMHALGLHLDKMMNLSKARGVTVKGDDLYLDPLAIIPNPVVDGKLKSVRIEGPYLVQEFFHTPDDTIFGSFVRPDPALKNFIYFRGGSLRFGRLTMSDTDLMIRDADERDPFDLYFPEYNRQLVAGHSNTLPNKGLLATMVDFGKLGTQAPEKAISSR
ncbi:MAG: hypothetical protein JF589_12725 [Gemmatimonadetes bacterium]|nr:hypothetical protein [Gemmatimonadota bacterium]